MNTKTLSKYETSLLNQLVASHDWRKNLKGLPTLTDPTAPRKRPGWLRFSGSSLSGMTDGQHIYNHGDKYPVFARVKNGVLYAVGVEINPEQHYCDAANNCDYVRANPLYMKPVKLGRSWLTTVLGSAGNMFADMNHQEADGDFTAQEYLAGRQTLQDNWKASVLTGSSPVPVPSPSNPTPTNPTTPSPTNPTPTNPSPSNPVPPAPSASGLSQQDWLLWGGLGLGIVLLLILVITLIVRR